MGHEDPGRGDPIGPLDWLKIVPFESAAASHRLGWVGLEAVRYRAAPAFELNPPAITHHNLVLFARPPEDLDLRYEGVKRYVPHQYVLARRVERAKQLLQGGGDFSLAQVAARVGFSDHSAFSHHFKRLAGVTPGQFRTPARIE
jgi:AraC-like DNA-binding protein